ncbi:DNA helicase [Tanacetum coccineum]
MAVHLEDRQRITFRDRDRLQSVVNLPGKKETTLTEWFAYNARYQMGRHLSYLEFPSEFVWRSDSKTWSPWKNSKSLIGRLAAVCHALGLLGDDKEWEIALEEAYPSKLLIKFWTEMTHDILKRVSDRVQIADYHLNADSLQGYTLYELEIILNNYGKSLQDFGLPSPPADLMNQLANRLLMEERNYNREELTRFKNDLVPRLNSDQKAIYDLIINAYVNSRQELIFVYGHSGTRKTFLWKTIISSLHSQGKIVLVVASLGIASLLLPSGRTTHSRFKFPLELTKESLCRITKNTKLDINIEEHSLVNSFASWLLDIGDGKIGQPAENDPENISWINIPDAYCLPSDEQGLPKLIDFIYDQSTLHTPSAITLQQKAIVCPKNETADIINSKVLDMVPGKSTSYMSQDKAQPTENDRAETEMLYPIEHLNTLKFP